MDGRGGGRRASLGTAYWTLMARRRWPGDRFVVGAQRVDGSGRLWLSNTPTGWRTTGRSPTACWQSPTCATRTMRRGWPASCGAPPRPRLFTFLLYPGMHPTNNLAERLLREVVIFHRTWYGVSSRDGMRVLSIADVANKMIRIIWAMLHTNTPYKTHNKALYGKKLGRISAKAPTSLVFSD